MDKAANFQELKALALDLGFDLFGVANVMGMRRDFLLEPKTRDRFGLAGRYVYKFGLDATEIHFYNFLQEFRKNPVAVKLANGPIS
jgi:hypothetical protein